MLRRAIVVGASSGIGAALVRRLANEGHVVAAVARRGDLLEALAEEINGDGPRRVRTYVHDVTDTAAVPELFGRIAQDLDGLDTVVYAAGIMPRVELDEFDTACDLQVIEVNVSGAVAWLNEAAKRFHAQGSGLIVGIGSVAGDRGRIGFPVYGASKSFVHSYLESLRNRLARRGVHVLTVKPGPTRTPMTEGLDKLPFIIEADDAAARIQRAMARRVQTAYVPGIWAPIMAGIRMTPSLLFRRMSI